MIAIYAALMIATGDAVPTACAQGIYAVAKNGELIALPQVKADHRKVTNILGAMMLGPLGGNKLKIKTVVMGADARTRLKVVRPEFRFCFPASAKDAGASSDYVGATTVTSPRDYRLVRFEQGKNQRELALAAAGGFGGPRGQIFKSAVLFQTEEVAPGQYRVTLSRDLDPGEYGFISSVSAPISARQKDVQELVNDFAITN